MLNLVTNKIDNCLNDINSLYDVLQDYILRNIDFHKVEPILPIWIIEGGRTPDCRIDKNQYEKLRNQYNHPTINRIIYWYDIQILVASLFDRIESVKYLLNDLFHIISSHDLSNQSANPSVEMSSAAVLANNLANGIIIALASAIDYFSKISYEITHFYEYNFLSYKRMNSQKVFYDKNLFVFKELSDSDLLFSEPDSIKLLLSLRSEYLHCGGWSHRYAIYKSSEDDSSRYLLLPDIDRQGLIVSSGSRSQFFSQNKTVNKELPMLINNVISILDKTIVVFHDKCLNEPKQQNLREENTRNLISFLAKQNNRHNILK